MVDNKDKALKWYTENRPMYEQLSQKIQNILQEIIKDQQIHIHAIYCRAKEIKSFEKKIENLKYTDPIHQITDCAGIRIITYVENDLEKVSKIIEENFTIDEENSIDKSQSLGTDKVGYRSIHYICQLSPERTQLPEYKKFKDFCFEIQVRTILQHGWAEIEHDKDYKFSGELPAHLKRRFSILAGVLELADKEFNQIATEIDKYSKSVTSKTQKGKLDIPIDSTSLKSYLEVKFSELISKGLEKNFGNGREGEKTIISELQLFGITTLKELDNIIPENFTDTYLTCFNKQYKSNYMGLLRDIMLINDSKQYIEKCWRNSWNETFHEEHINLLKSYNLNIEKDIKKYGVNKI